MSSAESFATQSPAAVIQSYLYQEYAGDDDLQAFVDAYNSLAQGYYDWFLQTPLGLYTSPNINGPLLDWTGQGIYDIARPVLSSQATMKIAGYNEYPYDTMPYDGISVSVTGTAQIATDDIYKRVLTWHLYRGDGQQFTILWLKRRVARFLLGVNGSDVDVLDNLPSITVSNGVFTIDAVSSPSLTALAQCVANNVLALPFQYSLVINGLTLFNDGGVLQVIPSIGYPSNSTGLPAGSIYSNGGAVSVVPGITPNPAAPPVYLSSITAAELYTLGGGNLPFAPLTVTATNQLFGTGNGSSTSFQLVAGGFPVQSGITITSIFRNDWQGNQLLYSTARTNLLLHSQDTSAGTATRGTTSNASTAGADGGQAIQFVETTASGGHHFAVASGTLTAGSYAFSLQIKPNGRSHFQLQFMTNAASINLDLSSTGVIAAQTGSITNASVIQIANGTFLLKATIALGSTGSVVPVDVFSTVDSTYTLSYTGDGVSGFYVRFHMELAAIPGSYIPTTTATATVTDYTAGSTGLVAMGQTPVTGAQLTWNGSGKQSGTGQLWNNGGLVCVA